MVAFASRIVCHPAKPACRSGQLNSNVRPHTKEIVEAGAQCVSLFTWRRPEKQNTRVSVAKAVAQAMDMSAPPATQRAAGQEFLSVIRCSASRVATFAGSVVSRQQFVGPAAPKATARFGLQWRGGSRNTSRRAAQGDAAGNKSFGASLPGSATVGTPSSEA